MNAVTQQQIVAVLRRATPSGRRAALGLALGICADVCVVALLALSMWLLVRAGEQPPILHLTFAIVGVRAFAIGRAAFRYAERIASHDAALAQLATLRAETFAALVPRVPGAIESHRRGDVLAAFVDDVDQLQDQHLRFRQPMLVSVLVVGLSVLLLTLVSPLAGLVTFGLLIVSGWFSAWLSKRTSAASDRSLAEARAALSDALLERFSAAEVLAAFGAVDAQRARIADAEQRLAGAQATRVRSAGLTAALLSFASGAASLVTLLALMPALRTDGAGIPAPLFAAAVIVPAAVFEVFAQVPAALVAQRTVLASARRVARLTEVPLPPEIPIDPADPAAPAEPARAEAPILAVRDLSVRHPGVSSPAFSGVSFELRPGRPLVVTGQSGSGKSTLALALVRLLEYSGSYRLGGVEVRGLRGDEVRRTVGLIEQHPHLFDSDLRQNLKFARDTASDEELLEVLGRVGLEQWALQRGGLDAEVGERGALVSGGQAQRIALARAILADFPVVILDEPTAGVDRELADRLLTELLGALPADRAVILITHTEVPVGIAHDRLAL